MNPAFEDGSVVASYPLADVSEASRVALVAFLKLPIIIYALAMFNGFDASRGGGDGVASFTSFFSFGSALGVSGLVIFAGLFVLSSVMLSDISIVS